MASITQSDSQLLFNLEERSPFFPEGLVERQGDVYDRARKTLMAKELSTFLPENANSYFIAPQQQSNIAGLTTNNGTAITRFELTAIPDLAKIDSVRIDFDVQLPVGAVNNAYLSPTPTWFSRIDISCGGSASSTPIWSSISQGGTLPDHLFHLFLLDRDDAIRILSTEGYAPGEYVRGGEDNISFSAPAANQVLIEKHSPLEAYSVVAPNTTRTFSLYILGSFLTQTGFNLAMLRGSEKCTISLSWKQGALFVDPSQPCTISDMRLSFEGKRCSSAAYQKFVRALEVRGRSISIPMSRPITQYIEGNFTAGTTQSLTLTQFSRSMLGIFFYIGLNNPSMSSGVGTPEQRQNTFIQEFAPQVITINSGAGTSSVVNGSIGDNYQIRSISLKAGGTVVYATPGLSASQVSQLGNSAVENQSYLLPIYGSSMIVYPFSSNLKESVVEQRAFSHGCADLQGSLAVEFINNSTISGARLFVTGLQACTLVYSPEEGVQVRC